MKYATHVFWVTCILSCALLLAVVTCSDESAVPDELDGSVAEEEEVVTLSEATREEEEFDEPATVQDVREELLDGMPEEWPQAARAQTIDIAMTLHRMGQEYDQDPIMLADEYLELLRTTVDLQPIFLQGRHGGIPRAMLVTADLYQGSREVRDLSCAELDEDRFDEDVTADVEKINPYILLSIGYRESRLSKRVELGEKLGGAGERGMFQFRPHRSGQKGFIEARFMPRFQGTGDNRRRCTPFDRMCAVRGVANALAWIRCECMREYEDRCNIDTYVAGYGLPYLPDPAKARHSRGPRNARRFLCHVRDDCDSLWPIDHDDDFALQL